MWRKQEEPKASSPVRETPSQGGSGTATAVPVSPTPVPAAQVAAPAAPVSTSAAPSASVRPQAAMGQGGYLTSSLVIKGEITGGDDLFIDGEVQGKIRIDEGTVTIGSNGRVNADVIAREIVVQGRVKGNLHGRERVQIGRSGHANGNVLTRRISIEDGAEVHGSVEITPAEAQGSARTQRDKATPKAAEPAEPVAAQIQN